MLDPSDIKPGVYEVRHGGDTWITEVYAKDGELIMRVLALNLEEPLRTVPLNAWQFTARYVRCEGTPVECWGVLVDGKLLGADVDEAAIRESLSPLAAYGDRCKIVRGVFIPEAQP